MMTVTPILDYVLIRRTPDVRVGRIHVPDGVDTKARIGIVEAVGPGRRGRKGQRLPMSVQVGDRVTFDAGAKGFVSQLPGAGPHSRDLRLLIPESGILAVLDPDAEASALGSPWPGWVVDGPQDPTEAPC